MGNLFRCSANSELREYILKVGGIVQAPYVAKYITENSPNMGGEVSATTNFVFARANATAITYYYFDATKWNKLHVKQVYAGNYGARGNLIGICTPTESASLFEERMFLKYKFEHTEKIDYVFDISNITGSHVFCLFVKVANGTTSNYLRTFIDGDVYLTK